ncbi:MAG: hypothetical protein LGL72_13400 [Acidibrevibacterium sp.]|jgi:hypothetical protein|uniref:hypothetical protein n=1 Tax=Acidibrevibacterium fodinaquatile TaxID=1969806 RepID=UPI000E0D5D7F|nr:hypothetical protein [Acidibrevibacterium fodinaquatile]MCA7120368.1 hypothetical protein [Acidibrevibacterium fodinaquatile]
MFRVYRLEVAADEDAARQTASLAGLAVVLFLLVVGVFLVQRLSHAAAREDCLLAGGCRTLVVVSGGQSFTVE